MSRHSDAVKTQSNWRKNVKITIIPGLTNFFTFNSYFWNPAFFLAYFLILFQVTEYAKQASEVNRYSDPDPYDSRYAMDVRQRYEIFRIEWQTHVKIVHNKIRLVLF